MKKILIIILSGFCLLQANVLLAETNVSIFGGYRGGGEFEEANTGEKLSLDENGTAGFTIDWDYVDNTTIQLFYSHQETQLLSGTAGPDALFDLDIDYLGVGGSYKWPGKTVEPYLASTLGITHFKPEADGYGSKSRLHLSIGFGTLVNLSKRIGLKFEARTFGTFLNSDGAMFCNNGNCTVFVSSSALLQYELLAGVNFSF